MRNARHRVRLKGEKGRERERKKEGEQLESSRTQSHLIGQDGTHPASVGEHQKVDAFHLVVAQVVAVGETARGCKCARIKKRERV